MYKMLVNKNQEIEHIEKEKLFYPSGGNKELKRYATSFNKKVSAENTFLVEKLRKNEVK